MTTFIINRKVIGKIYIFNLLHYANKIIYYFKIKCKNLIYISFFLINQVEYEKSDY